MSTNIYGYKEPQQTQESSLQNTNTIPQAPIQFELPEKSITERALENQTLPEFVLDIQEEDNNVWEDTWDFLATDEDQLSRANEDLNFFSRIYEESKMSSQMAQSQKYMQDFNLKRLYGQSYTEEELQKYNEEQKKLESYTQMRDGEGFLWGMYRSTTQSFIPQVIQGGSAAIEGGLQAGSAAAIASLPLLATGVGTPIAAGTAFTAGATYGATMYGFEQNAAEIYGSIVDIEGANGEKLDEDTARILATLGGTLGAGLEMVGLNQAMKVFPQLSLLKNKATKDAVLKALENPNIAKALGKSAASIATALGSEVVTEVAQTGVQLTSQEVAKALEENFVDANPLTKEQVIENLKDTAFETIKSSIFFVGGMGGVNITRANLKAARDSVTKAQSIQNLLVQSNKSSLVKENPFTAEQEFQTALQNKEDINTSYFSPQLVWETLFQNEDTEALKLAQKLGINREDVADALFLDTKLAVPTSKVLSHLANTPYQDVFAKNISYNPNDLTLNEVEQTLGTEITEEQLNNLLEASDYIDQRLEPLYQEQQALDELDAIAQPYVQPLIEAGYSENQAIEQSRVFATNAQRMAPLFNQSPQEFLQNRLQISSQDTYQDEKGLFQAMQESKASNLEQFTNEARTNKQAKQEYFTISKDFQGLEKHGLGSVQIDLTHGFVRHMDKKRSKKTISLSQEIENILSNTEELELIYESPYGNRYATVYKEKGKTYALIFNLSQGKKGNKVYPVTTYTGNEKTIRDIIEKEKRVNRRSVSQNEVPPTKQELSSENNIATNESNVNSNELLQQAKNRPRGMIQFNPMADETQAFITIFKDRKNLSTVLHEASHFFLRNLHEAYNMPNAPTWVKESFETLAKELNFDVDKPLSTEIEESFARLGEAYFREGKAPRKELEGSFAQFKNWLTAVYRYVTSLLKAEEINDNIRQVFDNLLATESQIEEVKTRFQSSSSLEDSTIKSIFNVEESKLTAYQEAVQKGKNRADAIIALRKQAGIIEVEKEARTEAIEAIKESPIYQAFNQIREQGKLSFESLLGFVTEEKAYELLNKWNINGRYKQLISQSKGMSIDEAAAFFNVDGESFISYLLEESSETQFINNHIEAQRQNFEANFDADIEYISIETEKALALEIEALGGKALSQRQIQAYIDQKTEVKKADDIDKDYKNLKADLRKQQRVISQVISNLKKELNEENKENLKNELITLKQQEQVKRALLKKYYEEKIIKEKVIRNVRKIAKSKTIPDSYKQQILQLIASFKGLGTKSMQAKEGTIGLSQFIATMYEQVEGIPAIMPPEVPEWLFALSQRPNANKLNNLTSPQLQELYNVIKSLAYTGRQEKKLLGALKRQNIENAVNKLIDPLQQMTEKTFLSDKQKKSILSGGFFVQKWRNALSAMSIMRYTFKKADGFSDTGFHNELIIQPIQKAQTEEQRLLKHFNKVMHDIWAPLASKNNLKEFDIQGIALPNMVRQRWGNKFNMNRVIAVALNMGNEGNLKALMKGYNWTMEDLQTITSYLSEEHFIAIQKTWDMLEELKPHIKKTYKEVNGADMSEVKGKPIQFTSKEGSVITLRGGYYPLQFDKDMVQDVQIKEDINNVINANAFIPNAPNTKKGMTIERTGTSLPPLLDFAQVVNRHLTDSIKYATHTIPVRNAYELVRNQRYKDEFIHALTEEEYNQIIPWLKSIATIDRAPIDEASYWSNLLVKRGSLYAMGFSLRTMLMQFTGIPISINKIGAKAYIKGAIKMIGSKSLSYNQVKKLSPYMASRSDTFDKTITETLTAFDPNKHALRIGNRIITRTEFDKAVFGFISTADALVAFPTWIGEYDKQIAKGTDPQEAITLADAAVIEAQGSGLSMDVNALMRKKGALEFLLMFMSFAMNWQNRQRYYISGYAEHLRGGNSQINSKEFFKHFALEWVAPVMLTLLMQSLQEDELPDGEDIIEEFASYALMGVPIVRDVASGLFWDKDFGATAAGSGFNMAIRAGKGIYKQVTAETSEEYQYNTMKNIINTAGFFAGIPTNSVFRAGEGTISWLEGKAGIGAIFLGKPYNKDSKKPSISF